MAIDMLGFHNKEMRDAKWRELRAAGEKGLARYSTHERQEQIDTANGEIKTIWPILYVVTWSTPKPVTVGERK